MENADDTAEAAEQPAEPVPAMAPAYTALAPGTLVGGRFEVESQMNMGGLSLIYRALDRETGEYIVLKECAPEGLAVRDMYGTIMPTSPRAAVIMQRLESNFRLEAQVLAKLTNAGVENITGYVADFAENGTRYIAMQEARGKDLHSWAMRFRQAGIPFPADALEEILTGLLDILGDVHAQGLFHCDVKPANIVIDAEGNITLIDFGAVRSTGQQHDENVLVSPGFSPPEFYPGHRELIGPWTDIYMLAALFYEIIAGRAPEPANERAVRDRTPRLANDPKLHKIYPAPFLISIDKALSLDPADRFASAKLWEAAYTSMQAAPQLLRAKHRQTRKRAFASGKISLQAFQSTQRGKVVPTAKVVDRGKGAGPLTSAQVVAKPGAKPAGKPMAAAKPAAPKPVAKPAPLPKPVAKPAPAPKPVVKPVAKAAPAPAPAPRPAAPLRPQTAAPAAQPTAPRPAAGNPNTLPLIVIILELVIGAIIYCML